jgi:polysaccharide export outer membrane protein
VKYKYNWWVILAYGFLVSGARLDAQANSDFMAYPRDYLSLKEFTKTNRQLSFNRLPGITPDYRLGPGDVLMIDVAGHPQLQQNVKISATGDITMPLLGSIRAADLTSAELEAKVQSLLQTRQLVLNPEVLVFIMEYFAKRIYILGQVDRPGEYTMSQPLTVMDAIMLAGGLDLPADNFGYLHRRISTEPNTPKPALAQLEASPQLAGAGTEVRRVDLGPLKEGGLLADNAPLKAGDVFVVPRRKIDLFYVIGDVRGPGPYEVPVGTKMNVSQAISRAGGPMPTATLSGGMLVRSDETGKRSEMNVDFLAILRGKQPDIELNPNDVVFIPGSNSKTITLGLLSNIPAMVHRGIIFAPR